MAQQACRCGLNSFSRTCMTVSTDLQPQCPPCVAGG